MSGVELSPQGQMAVIIFPGGCYLGSAQGSQKLRAPTGGQVHTWFLLFSLLPWLAMRAGIFKNKLRAPK